MAKQVYIVLENHNNSGRNIAYSFFRFPTLSASKECKEVDEYSIVFSDIEQLQRDYSAEDLKWTLVACNQYPFHKYNEDQHYTNFFEYVKTHSKKYKPVEKPEGKKMTQLTPEVTKQLTEIIVDGTLTATPIHKLKPHVKIKKLMDLPPVREGTNRYRNMMVVLNSDTLGEALESLRKLEPSPGSARDITIAIENKVIQLGTGE